MSDFNPITFNGDASDPYLNPAYYNHVEQGIAGAHIKLATKADLVGGKIPLSQVPASVLVDVFEVASQAEMLALAAGAGDVAIRTDQGRKTYILSGNDPTILDRWKPFVFSTIVSSVDGQTGDIDLTGTYAKNYDPDHTYPQYAVCFYLGIQYFSRVAGNKAHQPDISPTQWKVSSGGVGVSVSLGYTFDNGTIDTTIDGFVPYMNTTPAATPEVSPAGTVPTGFVIAWNGSNPIIGKGDLILTKPAISCYGAGFYHDFHIDRGCLGTIAKLLFRFMTSANYADGYLQMFILDKTNSNFILAPNALPATYASISDWLTTFIPSSSTEYRLYIHCATSTTTAWTVEFGGFELGRRDLNIGYAGGRWNNFVPSAITNLPGTWLYAKWRREGENAHFVLGYQASGAATGNIVLPTDAFAGLSFDTDPYAYIPGSVACQKTSSSYGYAGLLRVQGGFITVNGAFVNATNPITWAATDRLNFEFSIPVSGWTSNVNLASDFTEYASNDGSGGTAAATNYDTGMVYGAGGSNIVAVSSTSTTPLATSYLVSFKNQIQSTDRLILEIDDGFGWRPAEFIFPYVRHGTARYGVIINRISGNTNSVYVSFQNGGSGSSGSTYGAVGSPWANYSSTKWRVRKVSNGNMAEIPTIVRAEYNGSTIIVPTATVTILNAATKVEDTHNAVTNPDTAWRFTAPIAGVYTVDISTTASVASTTVGYTKGYLYKNGTPYRIIAKNPIGNGSGCDIIGGTTIRLSVGDYIQIYIVTANNTSGNIDSNKISVTWLGK